MANHEVFEVIKPGMQTMVQDLGRTGFQKYGIIVSGAMDPYAFRMANILAGNGEHAAALEMTMTGPKLYVKKDCAIAITGADMSPVVDGARVPMWTTLKITKGSIIEFGPLKNGCRAYLAVNGGLDVPVVLGSRSTYMRAQIGGLQGRALQSGDILCKGTDEIVPLSRLRNRMHLAREWIPVYSNEIHARVIKGPQWDMFKEESRELFFSRKYVISYQSDRMGYRLKGPALELNPWFADWLQILKKSR